MAVMRIERDPEVQAWYLTLSDAPMDRTVQVSDEVAVDVDETGDVVGVEFLLAPGTIEPPVREALFARFPAVERALAELHSAAA